MRNVKNNLPCLDVFVGSSPSEMSPKTAFRIFPIVHEYGMQMMVEWCEKAFQRIPLDLWPPAPIATSEVPNHPGLVQCLALADAKQCDSLVQSCLSQLIKPGSSEVRNALVSPHLDKLVDGLRPETKDRIIRGMAGLPTDFKVGLSTQTLFACVESHENVILTNVPILRWL